MVTHESSTNRRPDHQPGRIHLSPYRRLARLWRQDRRPVDRPGGQVGITRRGAIIGAVAAVSVVTDYPDYSPHVATAQQVAATGVPLLTLATLLVNEGSKTIPGGSNLTVPAVAVSQIGYEIQVSASVPAAATNPFLLVELQWTDPDTGILCGRDDFVVPMGTTGNPFLVIGSGPTKAARLSVVVFNLEGTQTASVSLFILQNSRVYQRDAWHWDNPSLSGVTVPGFTLPGLPSDQSALAYLSSVTVAAGSSNAYLVGMHAGLIQVGLDMGTAAWANVFLRLSAEPSSVYTTNNPLYDAQNPPSSFQVAGPRAPMRLTLSNTGTASVSLTMSMIAIG